MKKFLLYGILVLVTLLGCVKEREAAIDYVTSTYTDKWVLVGTRSDIHYSVYRWSEAVKLLGRSPDTVCSQGVFQTGRWVICKGHQVKQ